MIVRIGHYYFDNKPLLGKIADIQVWDKMLRLNTLNILKQTIK